VEEKKTVKHVKSVSRPQKAAAVDIQFIIEVLEAVILKKSASQA
jgi:hypothetical protein